MSIHYFTLDMKWFMKYFILLPRPGTVDSWTADPGTAEPQFGIAMADPGTAELQLGIHHADTFRGRLDESGWVRIEDFPITKAPVKKAELELGGPRGTPFRKSLHGLHNATMRRVAPTGRTKKTPGRRRASCDRPIR